MKKKIWIPLVAVAAAAAATASGLGIHHHNVRALEVSLAQAQSIHARIHAQYEALDRAAEESTLTVTEKGRPIGVYHLSDLGLEESADTALESAFQAPDLLSEKDFSQLSQEEQLAQLERQDFQPQLGEIPTQDVRFDAVLEDLDAVPRRKAVDCAPFFTGDGFVLPPEIPGTELNEQTVRAALTEAVSELAFSDAPQQLQFELTDCDSYLPPAQTIEHNQIDLDKVLQEQLADYSLPVELWTTEKRLDGPAADQLLFLDDSGKLCLDQEAAQAMIDAWAEETNQDRGPYRFTSHSAGKVEIPFLTVSSRLDEDALLEDLEAALCTLSQNPIEARYDSFDWAGNPFSISGTYIEVDIANQTMSCFQNDELVASTPVVTGLPWGHSTPPGYWRLQSKSPNEWLIGPDYAVFVKYWLGVHGAYGIHDASWRSIFGGAQYKTNGSHGCVNTPTEPMEKIYNVASVGTPVLMFNVE